MSKRRIELNLQHFAAEAGTTVSANLQVESRERDFVTRFALNWDALIDIMGIMRPIERAPGTKLVSKYAELTLKDGHVGEGEHIPYSEAKVKTKEYATIGIEKFAKSVTIEAINDHGREAAITMTDDQFLSELQNNVMNRFYNYIKTGTLRSRESSFQMALAMAQGRVINRWEEMRRGITQIVGFCNILDAYEYLGAANITVQQQFGMNYIENFLGYSKLFLSAKIDRGTVIATPVENIVLYYTNPANSDFMSSDLQYTVDGVTNLIGFHVKGDYDIASSKTYAIMGLTLFSEYLDGIAVISFGTVTDGVTVNPESGATTVFGTSVSDLQSGVSVGENSITGTLKYYDDSTKPLVQDWGEGHFLALKFTDIDPDATSVKVGLEPSEGSGLVELINDPDKNGVFKITDNKEQKFKVVTSDGKYSYTQYYDLSGLTMEAPAGA